MTKSGIFTFLLCACFLIEGCTNRQEETLDMENYFAWCIVPFDSLNRTPAERIEMLKDLGFKAYAYDWREVHLATTAEEFELAQLNNIKITAVWMWLDDRDTIGKLSPLNERLLNIVTESGIESELWISFPDSYFQGLSDDAALGKASGMIQYLLGRPELSGWRIGLYNHGGWFGNPENLVHIVEHLSSENVGIVFNFHHAHELLDQYEHYVDIMLPHLLAVNLNGMRKDGPMILPIGTGNLESGMTGTLLEKGYAGPFGVLGHVEDRDVKVVLQENLTGLAEIM